MSGVRVVSGEIHTLGRRRDSYLPHHAVHTSATFVCIPTRFPSEPQYRGMVAGKRAKARCLSGGQSRPSAQEWDRCSAPCGLLRRNHGDTSSISAVRLARLAGGQEVGGSTPSCSTVRTGYCSRLPSRPGVWSLPLHENRGIIRM
jgi:hypothetical protein